ncbi:MAG: tetratricopeptide repeat protein [Terriglobia bacterium]
MRIKQILWVLAAFVLTSALYGQAPTTTDSLSRAPGDTTTHCGTARTDFTAIGQGQTSTQAHMFALAAAERQAQALPPLAEVELTREIKSASAETVIKDVKERGVDFDMTPGIEKKLRKAQATDEMIEAARQGGPKVRAQTAKLFLGPGEAGAQEIPKKQAQGFDAIKSELDPDKAIGRVDDFARKYPSSILLSYAYSFGANAYQQKGDVEKVVEYTDKSLKLKPDNLMSLILSVEMLPLPQYIHSHPADRAKILQQTQTEADRALQLIPKIPKRANESDADYQKRLASVASEVHGALGTLHLELAGETLTGRPDKAELAKAEQEFATAVSTTVHPDPRDYYRMGEAYGVEGKLDDAIQAFMKAGEFGQGTVIKTYANEQIAQLKKRKAQGWPASNTSVASKN